MLEVETPFLLYLQIWDIIIGSENGKFKKKSKLISPSLGRSIWKGKERKEEEGWERDRKWGNGGVISWMWLLYDQRRACLIWPRIVKPVTRPIRRCIKQGKDASRIKLKSYSHVFFQLALLFCRRYDWEILRYEVGSVLPTKKKRQMLPD